MRFFNLEYFRKDVAKNDVHFTLLESNEKTEDFGCSICKELLTDPRITDCCNKNVCLSCWNDSRLLLNRRGFFYDSKVTVLFERENEIMWFICRLCSNMVPVPAMNTPAERFRYLDKLLKAVPEIFQQQLDAAMVICPDINCKVLKIDGDITILLILILCRKLFLLKLDLSTGRPTAIDL